MDFSAYIGWFDIGVFIGLLAALFAGLQWKIARNAAESSGRSASAAAESARSPSEYQLGTVFCAGLNFRREIYSFRQGRARAVGVDGPGPTPCSDGFPRPAETSASSSDGIFLLLSMAEGVHLQYVVRQANQRPFAAHLLQAAQEKPSHPAPLFDLPNTG